MRYIILAAGKGTRLQPLTLNKPKALFKLDEKKSILRYTIDSIRKFDKEARITVVCGFMKKEIEQEIDDVLYVENPFYEATNSIASLWFALKDCGYNDDITIINSDVVAEERLFKDIITKKYNIPLVLIDGGIKSNGDYNVQVENEDITIMSKDLKNYFGEYAGITKINRDLFPVFRKQIIKFIDNGLYNEWYETALNQMIFDDCLKLKYIDISKYLWSEIDCVDDLSEAIKIYKGGAIID